MLQISWVWVRLMTFIPSTICFVQVEIVKDIHAHIHTYYEMRDEYTYIQKYRHMHAINTAGWSLRWIFLHTYIHTYILWNKRRIYIHTEIYTYIQKYRHMHAINTAGWNLRQNLWYVTWWLRKLCAVWSQVSMYVYICVCVCVLFLGGVCMYVSYI
jgi:hypothetical protein